MRSASHALSLAVTLFLGPVAAKSAPPPSLPAGVRMEKNVDYLGADRAEKGDLYLPTDRPANRLCPAVVIIHGGGWTGGKKDAARELNIGGTLAANGYVAFSIDYVLASEGRPTWPQNLHDCKTAVRWLRKHAERLGVDAKHIGVIGGSAGGHLAAMVALTGPESGLDPKAPYGEHSCRVQAAVDLYGPADLRHWPERPRITMLPQSREENPELYRQASPGTHADKDDPPVLILHGTADKTVPVSQSEILAKQLAAAGAAHQLLIIDGAPHTFHLQPKQQDLRPVVLGFFDKHLKHK